MSLISSSSGTFEPLLMWNVHIVKQFVTKLNGDYCFCCDVIRFQDRQCPTMVWNWNLFLGMLVPGEGCTLTTYLKGFFQRVILSSACQVSSHQRNDLAAWLLCWSWRSEPGKESDAEIVLMAFENENSYISRWKWVWIWELTQASSYLGSITKSDLNIFYRQRQVARQRDQLLNTKRTSC